MIYKIPPKQNQSQEINFSDKLARANGMRWYGHVLRQPEQDVLIKAMVYKGWKM